MTLLERGFVASGALSCSLARVGRSTLGVSSNDELGRDPQELITSRPERGRFKRRQVSTRKGEPLIRVCGEEEERAGSPLHRTAPLVCTLGSCTEPCSSTAPHPPTLVSADRAPPPSSSASPSRSCRSANPQPGLWVQQRDSPVQPGEHGYPVQPPTMTAPSPRAAAAADHHDDPSLDGDDAAPFFVRALHSFAPETLAGTSSHTSAQQQANSCLSFTAGQVIRCLNRDPSGWWDGELDGRRGWFPSNYTEVLHLTPGKVEVRPAALSPLSPSPLRRRDRAS